MVDVMAEILVNYFDFLQNRCALEAKAIVVSLNGIRKLIWKTSTNPFRAALDLRQQTLAIRVFQASNTSYFTSE